MAKRGKTARDAAVAIVRDLRAAGHVAYLAGGCVRDALLGLEPKDYDVATQALPDQVRQLMPRSKYVGEAFGVVVVHRFGFAVEVATFREESNYADRRRPSIVTFTDAEHDAKRRDFTINGLFADPLETDADTAGDRIIDYVGGRADLQARLLRAIGEPDERFAEDYLRMLRAARFAARLGFEVEPETAAAIRTLARYLGQISRERIGGEIAMMLTGPHAARAASLVQTLRLDGPTLNEAHWDGHPAVLRRLDARRGSAGGTLAPALVAWMLDRHGIADADWPNAAAFCATHANAVLKTWRRALCLSNQIRDEMSHILAAIAKAERWHAMGVAQRKRLLAQSHWPATLEVLRCLGLGEPLTQLENHAILLHAQGVSPPPLVTGDDLIRMGAQPGPRFGQWLDAVYDAQLDGRVCTREQALAWLARHAGLQQRDSEAHEAD